MQTLILYASRYSSTADAAKNLQSKLNHNSELVNLKDISGIDLHRYDWIVIGSPVYLGRIQKEAREFCRLQPPNLTKKG